MIFNIPFNRTFPIVVVFLFIFSNHLVSQTITGELKKWHKITLEFTGPTSSETNATNPFTDYALDVNFIGPSGTMTVPGYFAADGNAAETSATTGNKWHVHFAPHEVGSWSYFVSFKTGADVAVNGGGASAGFMDGMTGSFTVAATDKTGDDLRAKGRVEYVGEHYLQYAETGEWFIKGGADAPENTLAYDDFDDVPNRANRRKNWAAHQQDYLASEASSYTWQNGKGSELLGVVRYLSSKGLNAWSFLTFSLAGDDHNVFPHLLKVNEATYNSYTNVDNQWNLGVHHDRFDVSRMAQWERVFEYADTKGMYLHFKTQETENDQRMDGGALGRERKVYYRELVARFSHHLALNWNVGEENTNTEAQRIDFADYLWNKDPYRNNVVIHTYPGQKNAVHTPLLGNLSAYTGLSLQTSNATYNEVFSDVDEWVVKSRNAGKKWVVAVDEPGNAIIGIDADPNDLDLVREKVNWATFMAGGAGVEYYYGYQTGCTDLTCQDHRTRAQKYTQLSYTLDFFQDHFQQYLPNVEEARSITAATNDYVLSKPGVAYAFYSPDGATTSINLPSGDWTVQWYNPRTGVMTNIINDVSGSLSPPDSNDWVGLITKCKTKVLFVRGGPGTGGFLEGGSDEQLADITNYMTTNGNHGWGEFADVLTAEGYTVEQIEEGPFICEACDNSVDFANLNLSEYSLIIFGSNNAYYSVESVDAVETYIRNGGAALFISDANFGADWWKAPYSDQFFLDRFGWTMNQDAGTYTINANEYNDPSHPIFENVSSFDGEGVSPITLSNNAIAGVTSSILSFAEGQVRRNTNFASPGPLEPATALDASLIIATADNGRIAGHFDRNTFFNLNGAGTNINRLANKQYAINLINWLTGCNEASGPNPIDIPSIVQAEDFISQSGIVTEPTTDTGGGLNIGFIANNDSADYLINVTKTGAYNINLRAASNTNGGTVNIYFDGILESTILVTNTGGWQSWQTFTGTANLTAGVRTMTLEFIGGSGGLMNVNWIEFECDTSLHFQLVNAATDMIIRNLNDGDTIDLTVDGIDLNILAILNQTVGSVTFGYDLNANFSIENVAPYALAGDAAGDYNTWTPTLGLHSLTATAYSDVGAAGTLLETETIQFYVIQGCPANQVDSNVNGIGDICETACQPNYILTDSYPSTSVLEFKAQSDIQSSSEINGGAMIDFNAGVEIELTAGFEVKTNAVFHAFILGCTP